VKVLRFSRLLDWLCPQCSNSGSNIAGAWRDRLRLGFKRREFELRLLSVFGANLDEGMNCADSYLKADAFVKNAHDIAIGAALASQLTDQFAVSFEFGARRFLRVRIPPGTPTKVGCWRKSASFLSSPSIAFGTHSKRKEIRGSKPQSRWQRPCRGLHVCPSQAFVWSPSCRQYCPSHRSGLSAPSVQQ